MPKSLFKKSIIGWQDLLSLFVGKCHSLFTQLKKEKRQYIYWFFVFVILMAFLEFGQDYISSALNGNYFNLLQSLSYKIFWLLFIPFSILLVYILEKTSSNLSAKVLLIKYVLLIPVFALVHLMLFAIILYGISNWMLNESWSLSFLITEKLSTRLYLSLSIYIIFSIISYLKTTKEYYSTANQNGQAKNIIVKNGKGTTLVNIEQIRWIISDGHYLFINTPEKKHVKLDSLKNIIFTLPDNFKRIHRSTIVNIDKVHKLNSRGNGDYDVFMKNGKKLRLSRNYTKPLRGVLL